MKTVMRKLLLKCNTEKLYCNCAECGRLLLSPKSAELYEPGDVLLRGRINGRPYCDVCLGEDCVRPFIR